MNGIPVKIEIDGAEEKIFLATRRSGPEGEQMRSAIRRFHSANTAASMGLQKVAIAGFQAANIKPKASSAAKQLEELLARQESVMEAMLLSKQECLAAAEELVRLSLGANYPEEMVERYLSVVSDARIQDLVKIIESGSCPADFFISLVTPLPESSTARSSGGRAGNSSKRGA